MGILGRHIDMMCKFYPDVMEEVLKREFGDLEQWVIVIRERPVNFVDRNPYIDNPVVSSCGCYIGTIGLVVDPYLAQNYMCDEDAINAVREYTLGDFTTVKDVGMQACYIRNWFSNGLEKRLLKTLEKFEAIRQADSWANTRVIRLIKERIHRNIVHSLVPS